MKHTPHPTFAFADLWELVCQTVPNRTAIVSQSTRRTFAEIDARASRLASWLANRGVGTGDRVGIQMRNCSEYVESSLAAYKLRAVAVNVNFRLQDRELRHLYSDAGLVGVIHEPSFAERVSAGASGAPAMAWALSTGNDYESAIAANPPLPSPQRDGDDTYMLYTGGTTGQPKGVVWRMEDAFFACIGGGDPTANLGPIDQPELLAQRILDDQAFIPAAPLIHAAGMWTTLRWLFAGAKVVLMPTFSPAEIWRNIARERVTVMNIVGDAMAGPLLNALAECGDLDLSSLRTVATGGAILTVRNRTGLLAALPQIAIKDSYGSSETGVHGWSVHTRSSAGSSAFTVIDTAVLDPDTFAELPPGTAQAGIVARRDRVPLRYHGDEAKTAATFISLAGHRYAITGDWARIEADGKLTLLGRGSQCINSGGEKIHPEEVEAVLRQHSGLLDAMVIGRPDATWGQRVVAIVVTQTPNMPTVSDIKEHCRSHIAGFKVPKDIVFVKEIHRAVTGKPDYRWAESIAQSALAAEED